MRGRINCAVRVQQDEQQLPVGVLLLQLPAQQLALGRAPAALPSLLARPRTQRAAGLLCRRTYAQAAHQAQRSRELSDMRLGGATAQYPELTC